MRHLVLAALTAVGLVGAGLAPVQAQLPYVAPQTNPFGTPVISPFINLARPGNPAVNFFGIVQPQIGTMNALQQLQAGSLYSGANPYASNLDANQQLVTGHVSQFQNHWGYFQNWRGRTGGGVLPNNPALLSNTRPFSGTNAGFNQPYNSGITGSGIGVTPVFGIR